MVNKLSPKRDVTVLARSAAPTRPAAGPPVRRQRYRRRQTTGACKQNNTGSSCGPVINELQYRLHIEYILHSKFRYLSPRYFLPAGTLSQTLNSAHLSVFLPWHIVCRKFCQLILTVTSLSVEASIFVYNTVIERRAVRLQ